MSVFDMLALTPTRKPTEGVCKDRQVPISNGVADGSRIGGSNFLSGITAGVSDCINNGIEQTIINGDQVTEVRGKQAAKITGDSDTHILGSLKILVDGDEERTVKSGRTTTIIGRDATTIFGDRYVFITATDTRIVLSSAIVNIIGGELNNEVSKKSDFIGWFRFSYGGIDIKATGGNYSIQVDKLDAQAWKTDLSMIKSELKVNENKVIGIKDDFAVANEILALVKAITGGISNKLDLFGS